MPAPNANANHTITLPERGRHRRDDSREKVSAVRDSSGGNTDADRSAGPSLPLRQKKGLYTLGGQANLSSPALRTPPPAPQLVDLRVLRETTTQFQWVDETERRGGQMEREKDMNKNFEWMDEAERRGGERERKRERERMKERERERQWEMEREQERGLVLETLPATTYGGERLDSGRSKGTVYTVNPDTEKSYGESMDMETQPKEQEHVLGHGHEQEDQGWRTSSSSVGTSILFPLDEEYRT